MSPVPDSSDTTISENLSRTILDAVDGDQIGVPKFARLIASPGEGSQATVVWNDFADLTSHLFGGPPDAVESVGGRDSHLIAGWANGQSAVFMTGPRRANYSGPQVDLMVLGSRGSLYFTT